MFTITYPFPPKELNPNKQLHWAVKAKHKKNYREICKLLTLGNKLPTDTLINMDIVFYPPDRRHRDDDNLVAAFKSGRDGIADALCINDKMFRIHPVLADTIGNKVVVTFRVKE
jgi:crossover junction endodeoxyribonuclease RusA